MDLKSLAASAMVWSQFQAATISGSRGFTSPKMSQALAEKEVRIGLVLVRDRCGLFEEPGRRLELVRAIRLQALGMTEECFQSIDILLLAVLTDMLGHQSADLWIESVPQRSTEDIVGLNRIGPGGLHGESQFDQSVGGGAVACDQLFQEFNGQGRVAASQLDRSQ